MQQRAFQQQQSFWQRQQQLQHQGMGMGMRPCCCNPTVGSAMYAVLGRILYMVVYNT
jgi:hypothetical protein